jgi:hypothetical protein
VHPSPDDIRLMSCSEEKRFWSKVDKTPWGCWLWLGRLDEDQYGIFHLRGKSRKAHRVAFATINEISESFDVLDHLCRVRYCVNPSHLEVVTARENFDRGNSLLSRYGKARFCKNGHEFTPENTYRNERGRTCRACAIQRACQKYPCPVCGKKLARGGLRQHIRKQHNQ